VVHYFCILPMTPPPFFLLIRSNTAMLRTQWLMLVLVTLWMVVASFGMTNSHGLAPLSQSHDSVDVAVASSHQFEHGHEPHLDEPMSKDAVAFASEAHPHHSMDHSHDTSHRLPTAWHVAPAQRHSWKLTLQPWVDKGQTYRLDRPPMA
jgi:hypothetical protein